MTTALRTRVPPSRLRTRPRRGVDHHSGVDHDRSHAGETWGDLLARHRSERHERRLRTAEALDDLDRAVRLAELWCERLQLRLEREERRIATARRTLVGAGRV